MKNASILEKEMPFYNVFKGFFHVYCDALKVSSKSLSTLNFKDIRGAAY